MKAIKQHFISLFIFLALMFGATAVFAQETPATGEENTSTTEEILEEDTVEESGEDTPTTNQLPERQENAIERREGIQANVAERQSEIQENVAERQAEQEERRQEIQENVAERRALISERTQERIVNLAANVSNRLDAATDRLQNIIDRIASRIEKLQARGIDTTEAERFLTEAQDAVDAAKAQLGTIDTMVSEAVTAEDPRTAWQRAKTQYLAIKESITSAHTSLRATVEALKVAIDQAQAEASEPTE